MEKNVLWESWSDLSTKLRSKFEKEIKQNNEKLERGEIESVEITDFIRKNLK